MSTTPTSLPSMWDGLASARDAEFLASPTVSLTHGDLRELVQALLAAFDRHGLRPGDRVLILSAHEGAAIAAFIAALLDGLVPVMLSPDTPAPRAAALAASIAPKLAVMDTARQAEPWAGSLPWLPVAPVAPPATWPLAARHRGAVARCGLDLAPGQRAPKLPVANDELAYLLFTSGTTQAPSGVMITRRNLLANLGTLQRLFGCTPRTRLFNDMVLAHGDGLVQGPLLALACGGALIRSGGFSLQGLEAWLDRVRQQRATHVITVPTIWALIDRYAQHDDYFDAPECSHLMSVADRLAPDLWRRLQTRFRRPLYNQYGLTETVASALYAGPHPEMGAIDSIGRPVDCEARLAPLDGAPPGQGELQLRGDQVFAGYWQSPGRSAEAFTPDGWLRTGDWAALRADGSYDYLGRIKAVILSGGFLIRPEEIDEALATHPAVAQVATVGLPDADFGEIAVSAVVLHQPTDEAALTAHARARLEALKVPKRIVVLPALPRGDAGKLRREALLEQLRERIAQAPAPAAQPDGATRFDAVRALAAEVFRVDPGPLLPVHGPDEVPGWDSFSQILLILAAEARFGISIPAARVAAIRCLGDLQAAIEASRA